MVMEQTAVDLAKYMIEHGGAVKKDASKALGITEHQFTHALKRLRLDFEVNYDHKYKVYVFASPKFPAATRAVASKMEKYGISGKELEYVFEMASLPDFKPVEIPLEDGDEVHLPTFGDLHCGHVKSRRDILDHFIDRCRRMDAKRAYNTGDTIEGISGRSGHHLVLDKNGHTVDDQVDIMLAEWFQGFSDYGIDVLSVEAQVSHTNWSQNVGGQGINTARRIDKDIPSYRLVGLDEATLNVDKALVTLRHPGAGSIKGNPLKKSFDHLDSLPFLDIPDVQITGHYHKMGYKPYKGVHVVESGTVQNQTNFMLKNGILADVGYVIITMAIEDGRVRRFTPEFVTNFNRW